MKSKEVESARTLVVKERQYTRTATRSTGVRGRSVFSWKRAEHVYILRAKSK